MAFSQRRQLTRQTWSIVKKAGIALVAAQAAAVVTVHAIDRMRTARIPGGVHGFPTLPPADTQIGDTVARTYTEGTSLYADMLEAIEGATHHIYFETFIWRSDRWGQRFKTALIDAAKRGVEVFCVWDGFGVLNQDPRFYKFPAIPNLHVRKFPMLRSGFFTLNVRRTGQDHRKILVVDGEVGFVGGYNIGDPFANEWRDTHVRITGEAVWELENGFVDFWNHFRPKTCPELPDQGARAWSADVTAQFNLPHNLLYPIRGMYIDAIERATDRVLITTAYFIPDREVLGSLIAAARRGVRVQVLIPEYSNHILADWVARPYYGELLRDDGGRALVDDRHGEHRSPVDARQLRGVPAVLLPPAGRAHGGDFRERPNDSPPPDDRRVGKALDPHPHRRGAAGSLGAPRLSPGLVTGRRLPGLPQGGRRTAAR